MTDFSKNIFPLLFGLFFLLACNPDIPKKDTPPVSSKETVANAELAASRDLEIPGDEKPAVENKGEEKPEKVTQEEKKEEAKPTAKTKEKKKPKKRPKMSFISTTHDYGMIMQGDKVEHNFTFTNKGNADLLITNVSVSCGCTHPSYPFIPIAPGEEGTIGVVFDSKGKLGRQIPTITVVTNARPHTYKLKLEGFVDAEREKEQPGIETPESSDTPKSDSQGEGL